MSEGEVVASVSFAAEVIADSSGKFCGNGLRFATREEAEVYARDLAMRWTLVREWRVVESTDPVNYALVRTAGGWEMKVAAAGAAAAADPGA